MKIMIIFENVPECTDVYLVDDNDGNRNMADVLSGHYAGVNESDQFIDAYEHLIDLIDSGDAELIWAGDKHCDAIDATNVSMVCITGVLL